MDSEDENAPADCLHEGYATVAFGERSDDYYWICASCFNDFKEQFRWKLVRTILFLLIPIIVSGCAIRPSNHTHSIDTWVHVPHSEWALFDESGKELSPLNSPSYTRAFAHKLKYKDFVFYPQLEKEQMRKKIQELKLGERLSPFEKSRASLVCFKDGRVLASGGEVNENGIDRPIPTRALLDPKAKTLTKLSALHVPRSDDAIVELGDKRIIFIGGQTTKEFADDGTDNLTDTVEQLDLNSGASKIIGRISVPRHGVIARLVGDNEIFIVGGWNQRQIARDERWWPGAELFRIPADEKVFQDQK
jgi:hypothetical protein